MTASSLSPKPDALPGRGSGWQHKKGTFYQVAIVSLHSEDLDVWLVTYDQIPGGDAWTRAFTGFRQPGWPAFTNIFQGKEGHPHRFIHISGPRSWKDEEPDEEEHPFRAEFLEMLDNVSTSAETILLQFEPQIFPSDFQARSEIVREARAVCDALLRPQVEQPIRAQENASMMVAIAVHRSSSCCAHYAGSNPVTQGLVTFMLILVTVIVAGIIFVGVVKKQAGDRARRPLRQPEPSDPVPTSVKLVFAGLGGLVAIGLALIAIIG